MALNSPTGEGSRLPDEARMLLAETLDRSCCGRHGLEEPHLGIGRHDT
jgi:hypothetical protein